MKKFIFIFVISLFTIISTTAFASNSVNEIILSTNDKVEISADILGDSNKILDAEPNRFFMSSDESIVEIDNDGVITSFEKEGVAIIYIGVNGYEKTLTVVVTDDPETFDSNLYVAENFLRNSEIMVGDENGNFNAENAMTRSEFAKIICKFTNREQTYKGYGCDYADVATDFWGYNYIMNATQAGYLQGYGNRVFGVNDTLTEELAITVLCRMLGDTYEDVSYIETSVDEKGGYSEGYISIAGERGIDIEGLQRTVPATRARVAKWLYQLYNIKNNF